MRFMYKINQIFSLQSHEQSDKLHKIIFVAYFDLQYTARCSVHRYTFAYVYVCNWAHDWNSKTLFRTVIIGAYKLV